MAKRTRGPRESFWWASLHELQAYIICPKCFVATSHRNFPQAEENCPTCDAECYELEYEYYDEDGTSSVVGFTLFGEAYFANVPLLLLRAIASLAPRKNERAEVEAERRKRMIKFGPGKEDERRSKDLAAILLFFSFDESLLANTIRRVGTLRGQSDADIQSALAAKKNFTRRQDLFNDVSGRAWGDVLQSIDGAGGTAFRALHQRLREARTLRDRAVHVGVTLGITPELVDKLLGGKDEMLDMHVAIYNSFVSP